MSHTTKINSVKVTNLVAMAAAVQALNSAHGLNLTMTENADCTLWYEKKRCAFVIDVPGVQRGLNVGFEGTPEDGYTPVFDAHGGWIAQHIGGGKDIAKTPDERKLSNIGKLMQAYAVEAVREVAGTAGAMMQETFNTDTGEAVLQLA